MASAKGNPPSLPWTICQNPSPLLPRSFSRGSLSTDKLGLVPAVQNSASGTPTRMGYPGLRGHILLLPCTSQHLWIFSKVSIPPFVHLPAPRQKSSILLYSHDSLIHFVFMLPAFPTPLTAVPVGFQPLSANSPNRPRSGSVASKLDILSRTRSAQTNTTHVFPIVQFHSSFLPFPGTAYIPLTRHSSIMAQHSLYASANTPVIHRQRYSYTMYSGLSSLELVKGITPLLFAKSSKGTLGTSRTWSRGQSSYCNGVDGHRPSSPLPWDGSSARQPRLYDESAHRTTFISSNGAATASDPGLP